MARHGLWTSATDFKELAGDRDNLFTEIATRQRRNDFWSITQFLPNPDPVLKKQGKDITAYQELLADAHLGGCVDAYKGNVQALEWEVDRGKAKSRPAKLASEAFARLDIERIIDELLDAPFFGYQPMEIVWEQRGGSIVPRDIVGKPQEWFVFDQENRLRFLTTGELNGILVDDTQIFVVQHQRRYTNQYGFPILSRCFWPVVFKKGGIKFWVTFTEKYGQPWVTAKYPDGWAGKQDLIDKFFDDVDSMVQDALIVLPQGSEVNVTTTGGTASAEIFKGVKDWANEEISKAVFGHGAAADSTTGRLGNDEQASSSVDSKKAAARKLVMSAFNHVLRKMTLLNFGESVIAPRFILFEEEDVDQALAERDSKLYAIGWRPTSTYLQKGYGFDESDFTVDHQPAPAAPPPTQFAEPSTSAPDPLDTLSSSITPEQRQHQMEKLLGPVFELVAGATDYGEVMEKLHKVYPSMNSTDLTAVLERAIFIAETAGRLEVDREDADE